jgi:NAD(P)-dependent dehydrogenase (short-subunit alcohol dehydrogenase family)
MELGLQGGIALVSGAGAGIGRATARMLAAEGALVALLDLDEAAARSASEELKAQGAEVLPLQCDVTDEQSVAAAVATVASTWGGIDFVVLCAGLSGAYGKAVDEIEVGQWDAIFDVNVKGQWLPVKHALPYLRTSTNAAVAIVASDSALVASPLHSVYCASKGAVLMLVKALAVDLRNDGIRVNCVCPSIVNTNMPLADLGLKAEDLANADYPVQQPEDIARYLTLLVSPVTSTINAHALVADFGYLAQSGFPA